MKIFLGIVLGILAAFVITIAGCAILLGGTANEIDKSIQEEQNTNAITKAEYDSIEIGDTQANIVSRFGPPDSRQDSETENPISGGNEKSSCIYYNKQGGEFLDNYQLCFTNGVLESKNDW